MYRNKDLSKLVGDFNAFLSSSKDSDDSIASTMNTTIATRLNFDTASFVQSDDTKIERRRSLELITAKSVISKLENKVEQLETSRKRSRLDFERNLEIVQTEDQKKKEKLQSLEQEVAKLTEKLNRNQESSASLKISAEHTKSVLEKQILSVQREKIKSDEKYDELICSLKNTVTVLKSTTERNDVELQMKSSEIEMLKEQVKLQTKKTEDTLNLLTEAEEGQSLLLTAQAQIKELETKLKNQEESVQINRIWQSQLQQSTKLEKENKNLKEEIRSLKDERSNILLLEEQIDSLEKALQRAEQRSLQCNQLQTENEVLNNRLKQWVDISEAHASPVHLANQIAQLQTNEVQLTLTCGELNTKINILKNEKTTLNTKLLSCEQMVTEKDKKLQQNSELIRRLQKKLFLLTKERDSLQHVLQSYENEVTTNLTSTTVSRIQSLENLLKSYQAHLEKLEADLDTANKSNENSSAQNPPQVDNSEILNEKLKQIEEQNAKLQDQVIRLQDVNNKLQEEKETLQFKIDQCSIKGDFDPAKTKVVHMKWNPIAAAQTQRNAELQKLIKENEMLHERVKILEEGGKEKEIDLTTQVQKNLKEQPSTQEIENIKEQLKAAQLKNQRLMEAFSEKSREIREACYILTGFRIDLVNTRQYKVISMYAESSDDFLLFKMNSKGEMQLLENPYSSRLMNLIENYLQKQNSIPVFLSSLTLDLFSQQTVLS